MRLYAKTFVISTSLAAMSLSGCSTISETFGTDSSYKDSEGKMVKSLEMPPNLFNPAKARTELSLALERAEQDALAQQDTYDHIPNFKAEGLTIQSNLSERWLEIDSTNSEEVWASLKRFFGSTGFGIEEERKDIGVMKTDYIQRNELVPVDDMGPITKLLNKWRPWMAEGVYDKYIARVETDMAAGKIRIYMNHHMLYSPDANEARDIDQQWRIRPYSPVMEALAQLKITETMIEVVEGEAFDGLALRANVDKSWNYLQAMVYRANWKMDKVRASHHEMWIQVPEHVKKDDSIFSGLAFWRDAGKRALPDLIKLTMTKSKQDPEQTILKAKAGGEGDSPLNAKQKRYVFESLGLLAE